ncbi:MAG: hypothetical protein IID41_01510 [Planctomycetes bacterium]|nr:hypothetical protein [Planctomycetota bacterium]
MRRRNLVLANLDSAGLFIGVVLLASRSPGAERGSRVVLTQFSEVGWHGQVLLPVVRTTLIRTGKSTCPCHPDRVAAVGVVP